MSGSRRRCGRARWSPAAPSRSWWPTTASAWSRRSASTCSSRSPWKGVRLRRAPAWAWPSSRTSSRSWAATFKWKRRWGRARRSRCVLNLRVALDPERRLVESRARPGSGRAGRGVGKKARRRFCRRHGEAASLSTPSRFAEGCAEHPANAALSGRAKPLAGLRVLLAEDNELNVESGAGASGRGRRLAIDWAPDGLAACRLFEEAPPGTYDVVLMDVQMPQLDGYGATRCIRSLQRRGRGDSPHRGHVGQCVRRRRAVPRWKRA